MGSSGHETGLSPTWAAVTLGAAFVEVGGFIRLVSNIREIERAMGDGVKRIYPGEHGALEKLRRVKTTLPAAS